MKYPEFVGPCSHRDRDYCIGSNFWKFYLIRTSFTLGELVSLVKVFRLLRLEWIFFGVQTMDTVGRCIVTKRKGKVKRTKSDVYETSK